MHATLGNPRSPYFWFFHHKSVSQRILCKILTSVPPTAHTTPWHAKLGAECKYGIISENYLIINFSYRSLPFRARLILRAFQTENRHSSFEIDTLLRMITAFANYCFWKFDNVHCCQSYHFLSKLAHCLYANDKRISVVLEAKSCPKIKSFL